ncbi:MAG: STT3 domain-containing protein [Promethearchaeota archaeon]
MVKVISSIKNLKDRLRAGITITSQNVLFFTALLLVIILAIVIRLSPIFQGNNLIKAFDPWMQYYNANYLSQHSLYDYFHWHDYKSWFPQGFDRFNLRPGLTFTVVLIYNFFNSLGVSISLYDICFYFPAFMGGLTVFAIYLLGKETLNRQLGLVAAFFLAFNPGYMQRTVAGFFDNETIGVFACIMTLYFFIKAIRTGKLTHAILGGLFLGYLSLSWGGYYFVYYLLPITCFILILTKKYNSHVLIAYAGVEGVGLLTFMLYTNFKFNSFFSDIVLGGTFLFTIILVVYHYIYTKKNEYPGFYNKLINVIKWGIIPVVLIVAIIVWIAPDLLPFGFGGRLRSVLSPLLRNSLHLTASVAEHAPSAWSVFYYNTLIPLMLLPLGLFFLFRRSNAADILLIVLLLFLFYFTGSMIRIILLFAPAACIVGAYGLVNILKIFGSFYGEKRASISKKRKRQVKQMVGKSEVAAVYFIVGIMCMAQVWHASNYSATQLGQAQLAPGGYYHDWEESLTWMKTNLAGTTVVVSWWDYGYWITVLGNCTSVNDNGTINSTRIGLTGMALMQTNEIYSAKILKLLKADYVLVYFGFLFSQLGGDEGKWPWMMRIANDHYQRYKNWGLEEDNWGPNSVFVESDLYNDTSGRPTKLWFQSQIVRLMFWNVTSTPISNPGSPQTFEEYYRDQINRVRKDNDGDFWASDLPEDQNGDGKPDYYSQVFIPWYTSRNGFVKLYKIDYTALESSFQIKNPEVFDSGFATFKLKNTGSKDLSIRDVVINGVSYPYYLGKGLETKILPAGEEDSVWVDFKSTGHSFKKNDVVNISVTASAESLQSGKQYLFSNATDNFFVKEAVPSRIKINEQNSKAIQVDENEADIYLEVQNTGDSIVILNDFYADSEDNILTQKTYLKGSPILSPGEKAYVKITTDLSFFPFDQEGIVHKIGVISPGGVKDEIFIVPNIENYDISMLPHDRIISPEASVVTSSSLRKYLPIELDKTVAYTYDNGTTLLNILVKNTGNIILTLDSVYLTQTGSWTDVDFKPIGVEGNILPNQEKTIKVVVSDYFNIDVNDEIGIVVSALFNGSTKAADVGFIQSLNSSADIKIIKSVLGTQASYIAANETGRLLIKNTGTEPISLSNIYLNKTSVLSFATDVTFLYGDADLGVQECALVSFDIHDFNINASNTIDIKITTNTTATDFTTFNAYVDSSRYNLNIEDSTNTVADRSADQLTIKIVNNGLLNVTLDSIYLNNTYIPLTNFSFITGSSFELQHSGGFITISISLTDVETFLGLATGSIIKGDKLVILARTIQGAEDTHQVIVQA